MSIQAKKLKSMILDSGRKVGILVAENSDADRAITGTTRFAARVINDSEKEARRLARDARAVVDDVRAKIHSATAPKKKQKKRP